MNKSPNWSHKLCLIINVDPGSRFASTSFAVHSKLKDYRFGDLADLRNEIFNQQSWRRFCKSSDYYCRGLTEDTAGVLFGCLLGACVAGSGLPATLIMQKRPQKASARP